MEITDIADGHDLIIGTTLVYARVHFSFSFVSRCRCHYSYSGFVTLI